jgi:hypothetical protein
MKKLASMFCLFTLVFAVSAATYEWVGGSGNWDTAAMWSPVGPVGATDDASINANGDYTADINIGTTVANDIEVGTTSSSGTQTLNVDTYSSPKFANLTIGPRGVFVQNGRNISYVTYNTGIITVQSNGIYKVTNKDMGNHNLVVDKGGTVESLGEGNNLLIQRELDVTINGLITGDGNVSAVSQNDINWYGDGEITGNGLFILGSTGHVFHGNLTIDRNIIQNKETMFDDDVILTINGTYSQTNGTRSIGALNSGEVATVQGDGDFNIVCTNALGSGELRFGGATTGNNFPGTTVFEGDGSLNFVITGDNYVSMNSTNLTLAKNCSISGGDQDGYVRINGSGSYCTVDMNDGKTFTLNEGGICEVYNRSYMYKELIIDDNSTLAMNGGIYRGRIGRTTVGLEDIKIGRDSAGTISTKEDSTSTFLTKGDSGERKNLRVRLYDKSITVAEKNSVLKLANVETIIDMTNSADWGWNENITLDFSDRSVIDPNVDYIGKFEALSTDLGTSPSLSDLPLLVNAMSFSTTNMTFELMENSDNDSDGTPDTVVYTKTLDFSQLSEGAITLTGFSGAEKVYYNELINPNGITFDSAKWVYAALPLGNGTLIVIQ